MGEWTQKKKLILAGCVLTVIVINLLSIYTPIVGLYNPPGGGTSAKGRKRPRVLAPEGCQHDHMCAGGMMCQLDFDYASYQTCICNWGEGRYFQPPVFDDEEKNPPFDVFRECKVNQHWGVGSTIWWILFCISSLRLTQYAWLTLARVIKNHDKLAFNSTSRALFLLCAASCWVGPGGLAQMAFQFGWDPYDIFRDYCTWTFMIPVDVLLQKFAAFEMPVAWIDLVLKTKNLSKTSTRSFHVLKFVIYAWLITAQMIEPHMGLNKVQMRKLENINKWVQWVIVSVPGLILSRMLCKNLKDTTNPNWKVATTINRTAITAVACQFTKWQFIIPRYIFFAWGPLPTRPLGIDMWCLWRMMDVIPYYIYLHYCLYGFRKYLQEYDTEYASQFFGFTTVGIQSRIQSSVASSTASSRMSSTGSSAASSVSKASSSASVAEGAKETA